MCYNAVNMNSLGSSVVAGSGGGAIAMRENKIHTDKIVYTT